MEYLFQAVPIDDSKTTYRSIDSIEKLTTTPIRDCETLDDLFVRAVRLFADTDCVGTRELLSEEDEKQANGKVFKKVIILLLYLKKSSMTTIGNKSSQVRWNFNCYTILGQAKKKWFVPGNPTDPNFWCRP